MTVMLYKHGGPHNIHDDMFHYIVVQESEVEQKIKEGWAKTTTEAKSGHVETKPKRGRKPKAKV